MIKHFYDSSSLVKVFVREMATDEMLRLYALAQQRIVSRLSFVEVFSAITRLERESYLSAPEADTARRSLAVQANRLHVIELDQNIVSLAQALLGRHKLRSLDAIQLASALSVADRAGLAFVSCDIKLLNAAKAEALQVIDPTQAMTGSIP